MNQSIQDILKVNDRNTIEHLIYILKNHNEQLLPSTNTCKTCYVELTPDNHRPKRKVCNKCIYKKECKYRSEYCKNYYQEKIKNKLTA